MIVYRGKKPSKMRNQPVKVDGFYFPSKKEARRYLALYALQRSGEIKDLKVHPRYDIKILDEVVTTYVADFSYWRDGKFIIEDVKGSHLGNPYALFCLKKKLMRLILDLEVTEVF